MNRKAIVAAGPILVFINLFVLIITAIKVLFGTGLILGIAYHKKLKFEWKNLLIKAAVFTVLTLVVMISTHYIIGPAGNHVIGMLLGSIAFFILLSIISLQGYKENWKRTLISTLISTAVFIIVSQISVMTLLSK